jgi:DNA-binding response OmpR family regulator
MKILIVDSSAWIPDRIAGLLAETLENKSIYKAFSLQEARTLFHQAKPTVVILDKNLPDNGSLTLLKEIKSGGKHSIVIVLSFRISVNAEQQCKLAGADYFLDKYTDFEELPDIIRHAGSRMSA